MGAAERSAALLFWDHDLNEAGLAKGGEEYGPPHGPASYGGGNRCRPRRRHWRRPSPSAPWNGSRAPPTIRLSSSRLRPPSCGAPDAEPAQPRALIGGHVVSTIMGLALLKFTGPHAWAAAAGVGLAVIGMYLTGTFHPPAGINPLLVISNNLSWSFLFAPVLAAAAAADGLCLCLAPLDGPPALARAL